MSTPHSGNEDTQWSWDGVPQVNPGQDPAHPVPEDRATYSPGTPGSGYAPVPLSPGQVTLQPGIIPLRPLRFAEFFDGGFRAIRFNPPAMLGTAAIVLTIVALLDIAFAYTTFDSLAVLSTGTVAVDAEAEMLRMFRNSMGPWLANMVGTTILTGLLIQCVTQSILGYRITLSELWAQVKPRILPLFGLTIAVAAIVMIATIIGFVLFGLAFVLLAVAIGDNPSGAEIGLIIIAAVTSVIVICLLVLYATVKTSLATPALMAEKTTVGRALSRSFHLTKGFFWRVAGILALTLILVGVMSAIVGGIVTQVALFIVSSVGSVTDEFALTQLSMIIGTIIGAVVSMIFTPFSAAVTTLIYTDLRMRREGLDLLLQRAANERA